MKLPRNPDAPRIPEAPRTPAMPARPSQLGPYIAAAAVAAVALWTFQQSRFADDVGRSGEATSFQSANQPTDIRAKPVSGDLRTIFTADDYPPLAQARGEEGTVQVRLTVDTTGQVATCAIIKSSGSDKLDRKTCEVVQARARFTPARDDLGEAVAATFDAPPIVWRLEG